MHVCLWCHCLCVCLSPCCCRARQAVPIKRAQGELLWQQLPCCAVFCVCVCVRVRAAVSWSCRADRPGSHGAGSSCVLCCRSGSLSHWSVVGTVSRRGQPRKTAKRLFFCFVLIFPLISLILQSTLLFICLIHSFFGPFCLLNLLFSPFIYISLSQSLPPLSPWPHHPSLSVRIHQLSGCVCVGVWLVFINRPL